MHHLVAMKLVGATCPKMRRIARQDFEKWCVAHFDCKVDLNEKTMTKNHKMVVVVRYAAIKYIQQRTVDVKAGAVKTFDEEDLEPDEGRAGPSKFVLYV